MQVTLKHSVTTSGCCVLAAIIVANSEARADSTGKPSAGATPSSAQPAAPPAASTRSSPPGSGPREPDSDQAPTATQESVAKLDTEYRALVEAALQEFQRGNYVEARGFFTQAHRLKPNARTLRSLGMVAYELKDYAQAATYFEAALNDPRQPLGSEDRDRVEHFLGLARSLTGRYSVVVRPPGTRWTVDGEEPTLSSDGAFRLSVGKHTLMAERAGYQTEARKLDVKGGEERTIELSLVSKAVGAIDPSIARRETERDTGTSAVGITEKWWFWALVAAAVGGAAVGTYALTKGSESREAAVPGDDGIVVFALEAAP